jgi:hypothetical protein
MAIPGARASRTRFLASRQTLLPPNLNHHASFRYSATYHFFTLFYGQSLDAMLFSQPKVNSTNLHDGMENGTTQKGDRIMARIGKIARPRAVRIQLRLIKLN